MQYEEHVVKYSNTTATYTTTTINGLGLNSTSETLNWVDELDPPIKAEYDGKVDGGGAVPPG